MKKKKSIILSCMLLFSSLIFTQELKLIDASKQMWSGGVAGRSGQNFHLQLTSEIDIKIDSIYVGGSCFVLKNSRKAADAYYWFKTENTYKVTVKQVFKSSAVNPNQPGKEKVIKKKKCHIPQHKGVALLIYYINGERKTLIVPKFKQMPYLSYP